MRALVLDAATTLTLQTVPQPLTTGECRVRVTRAGICGTDLQMLNGYAAFTGILGHEFVGIVEAAPDADAHWIRKRVVGEINVGCGTCQWCARGVKEHCPNRTVLGIRGRFGAFAESLSLPAANLHEIPDAVDDETAVFVEPVAAACRILEQVGIDTTTRVAVMGDGRLGNIAAQVLRTRTPHVTLFARHPHKLAIAQQMSINARMHDAHRPDRYDVVVDATGRPHGLTRAIELVKPRGSVILKSTCHGAAATALWPVAVHEITMMGSRCGPFAPAIALLASGAIQTRPLVAATFPLSEYAQAFDVARRELKVLFDMRR